jgi:hypothetical protein
MPFTLAHPAAILPLARTRLVFSALVIGSMAPDFPYLLALSTRAQFGHTLPGVFTFCLPAGLIVYWLFHRHLKAPLLACLPPSHQVCLREAASALAWSQPSVLLLVAVSVIIGAFTHIAWDSCTHANGWTVQHVPALQAVLLHKTGGDLKVFKVLQHGSSIVGLAVLAGYYRWWCRPGRIMGDSGKGRREDV